MSKWALHATSARQDYDSRPEGQRPASRWRPQCRGIILSLDLDTTLVLSREPVL
jgi:hypothetical protein